MFDQVIFEIVTEEELLQIRKLAMTGKYTYKITETTFDMATQNKLLEELKDEIAEMHKCQKEASKKMLAIETELLKKFAKSPFKEQKQTQSEGLDLDLPDNHFGVEAGMAGCVKSVFVKVGDQVIANETVLCTLEAMKTEIIVTADKNGTVVKVLVSEMEQINAQSTVCILDL